MPGDPAALSTAPAVPLGGGLPSEGAGPISAVPAPRPWRAGVWRYHCGHPREDMRSDGQAPAARAVPVPHVLETTLELLTRAKAGEAAAVQSLFERCLPALKRWARGRLPRYARGMSDTQDLVQEAILHTLHNLPDFESRHQGALQAYLRQAIANRIRDEIRRARRRPAPVEIPETYPDVAPSPLEQTIGHDGLARYERALERLRAADREAIVARIELGQSYEEIAVALGKPTANAARAAVTRALARLLGELDHGR